MKIFFFYFRILKLTFIKKFLTLKNGQDGKFYVTCILPQLIFIKHFLKTVIL